MVVMVEVSSLAVMAVEVSSQVELLMAVEVGSLAELLMAVEENWSLMEDHYWIKAEKVKP